MKKFTYYVKITDKSDGSEFERFWLCENNIEAVNNTFEDLIQTEGYNLWMIAENEFSIVWQVQM